MPNFDQTGPRGKGPKTGRGLGKCDDDSQTQKKSLDNKKEAPRPRRLRKRDASCQPKASQ